MRLYYLAEETTEVSKFQKIINFIIYGTVGCYRKAKAGNIITANE